MRLRFSQIYSSIEPVKPGDDGVSYSVAVVEHMPRYFVGKSSDGAASILISMGEDGRSRAPIRLENMDVQFNVKASVRCAGDVNEGSFAIIRCRSGDARVIDYFLTTAEAVVALLGDQPAESDIARAVNRLTVIFQRLRNPPLRSASGLFGELFVIHHGRDRAAAIRAWRVEESSRFDFARGDLRLDAKTTAGRLRIHTLSYDQCNPAPGTVGIIASLFTERLDGGVTLRTFLQEVEESIQAHPELLLKLRETVASTLGSALNDGLALCFDLRLARSSLRFFDVREIPAIRGELPPGVGNVQFQADLSGLPGLSVRELERRDTDITCFLPATS
jgi:hypothetical protein